MSNYIISVDPSTKNSGFVLWEQMQADIYSRDDNKKIMVGGKPIKINSVPIKNFDLEERLHIYNQMESHLYNHKLIIEQGFTDPKMLRGALKLEFVRGFISGALGLTPEFIHIQTGRKYYLNNMEGSREMPDTSKFKGTKEFSIKKANILITNLAGKIKVNNHDEAEALLIGGYYINNMEKFDGK